MKKYRFTDDDYKELARQLDNCEQASIVNFLDDGGCYTINVIAKNSDISFYEETLYTNLMEEAAVYRWYKYINAEGEPISDFDWTEVADCFHDIIYEINE